jgi:hypothetical protein
MQSFMVERNLGTPQIIDLHMITAAVLREAAVMRDEGDRVYYIGSTFLPEDGRCLCLFEAADADVVSALNRRARLAYRSVAPAMLFSFMPTIK